MFLGMPSPESTSTSPSGRHLSLYKALLVAMTNGIPQPMTMMFHTEWVNVQDDYRRLIKAKRGKNQAFMAMERMLLSL